MNNTEAKVGQARLQAWGTPSNALGAQGSHGLGAWRQKKKTSYTRTRSRKNAKARGSSFYRNCPTTAIGPSWRKYPPPSPLIRSRSLGPDTRSCFLLQRAIQHHRERQPESTNQTPTCNIE